MKITLIETVHLNGSKIQTKEILNNNDLRLEMIKDIKDKFSLWNLLDCNFDYKCENTKFGFKVVQTIVQNRETMETTIKDFHYN